MHGEGLLRSGDFVSLDSVGIVVDAGDASGRNVLVDIAPAVCVLDIDAARIRLLGNALGAFGLAALAQSVDAAGAGAPRRWCAAFVGAITPDAALDAALDRLEGDGLPVPVIVAADSPALTHLIDAGRYCLTLEFPLRYAQLEDIVASLDGDFVPLANDRLIGDSNAMDKVRHLIRQVAPHDTTVLLRGESGTGKEMAARTIHEASNRRSGPFVAINCGAIPSELLESELFGHEKGAFTGAIATRKGRFELAEGGTLFLDEIGDMSLPMQVKLLRVLQERAYEKVGSNVTQKCDVRIIAATHRNLEQAIGPGGTFREDLYYRLNVFPIELPALRERADDLALLIFDLGARLARRGLQAPVMSEDAMNALCRHNWPGNVRELANLVELLAVLHQNGTVHANDLPGRYRNEGEGVVPAPMSAVASMIENAIPALPALHGGAAMREASELVDTSAVLAEDGVDLRDHLAAIEISLIRQAMELAGGVVAQAAKLLRLQRTTLVEKLRKYDLADVGAPSSVS